MDDADDDARLVALFMQQQQMIEALLATRTHLLKQHDDCLELAAQMAELSVDVSAATAAPYSGGSKKRRGSSSMEDECGSAAIDDWASDPMGEEPVVYRSIADGDEESGAEPVSLERQVSVLTRMLAALEQPDAWDAASSAAASVAQLRQLSTELLAS
tara:strand:+ start:136 stop:609 length:474 start_codon:yes stop_codon:yes gene_type:complete